MVCNFIRKSSTLKKTQIIQNFLTQVCRCKGDWGMKDFTESAIRSIQEQVGDKKVLWDLAVVSTPLLPPPSLIVRLENNSPVFLWTMVFCD